jgi:phospholipid/cholesterol/gamma-HCH transport system substrate-binding protein
MSRSSVLHQYTVGLVVLIALTIFAGTILIIGQETRLFVATNRYRTNFSDASGLRVGSPVTMSGVRVGTITTINLPTDPQSQGIEVVLSIDEVFAARVREGTTAKVVFLQIVANEKAVDLNPGDPDKPVLREGAFIPPEPSQEILETGRTIADTLEQVTADLREILGAIRRGEGLLGKAIVDPEFGKEGIEKIDEALDSLNSLLARMERGEGLMGKALADQEFAEQVSSDLAGILAKLASISERLDRGEGLLGQMTVSGESDSLLGDAAAAATALKGVAERLESGEGLAARLVNDRELADRLSFNLDELVQRLASIATKIDQGQGTLGQLVNERTLHDDVEELITGVRSSKLMSWLFRRYHRKGEEELATQ